MPWRKVRIKGPISVVIPDNTTPSIQNNMLFMGDDITSQSWFQDHRKLLQFREESGWGNAICSEIEPTTKVIRQHRCGVKLYKNTVPSEWFSSLR